MQMINWAVQTELQVQLNKHSKPESQQPSNIVAPRYA